MRLLGLKLANILLLFVLVLFLTLVQTSIWYQMFYPVPPASFWLPVVVYLSLYRRLSSGILTIYLLGILLNAMTSMPLYLMLLSLLSVFLVTRAVRVRFHWNGATYIMLSCAVAVMTFHISVWLLSLIFETNNLSQPNYTSWFMQLVLTPLITPFLFTICSMIDQFTQYEALDDVGWGTYEF